jgi:hypothetical protein
MKKLPLVAIAVIIALGLPGVGHAAPKPKSSTNYTIMPPYLRAWTSGSCGDSACIWSDGNTGTTVETADTAGQLTARASMTSPQNGSLPTLSTRTVYSDAGLYAEGRIGSLTRPKVLIEYESLSRSSSAGSGACKGRAETWGYISVTASDGRLRGDIAFWSSQSSVSPYGPPHETGGSGVWEISLGPTCDGCWESSPTGTATVSFEINAIARMGQGCSGTASAEIQYKVKSIRFVST